MRVLPQIVMSEMIESGKGCSFSDIAGQVQAKQALQECVILPSLRCIILSLDIIYDLMVEMHFSNCNHTISQLFSVYTKSAAKSDKFNSHPNFAIPRCIYCVST